jgi:hypothetical protein
MTFVNTGSLRALCFVGAVRGRSMRRAIQTCEVFLNRASESDIVERPYFASFYSLIAQARLPHNPYLLLLSLARRDFPVLSLRFRRRISCRAFFLERIWLPYSCHLCCKRSNPINRSCTPAR